MGKYEQTEIVIQGLTSDFLKTNGIKMRIGATSLFYVQRWTFDVRRLVCSRLSSWLTIAATVG
jgi:hypothetical protein